MLPILHKKLPPKLPSWFKLWTVVSAFIATLASEFDVVQVKSIGTIRWAEKWKSATTFWIVEHNSPIRKLNLLWLLKSIVVFLYHIYFFLIFKKKTKSFEVYSANFSFHSAKKSIENLQQLQSPLLYPGLQPDWTWRGGFASSIIEIYLKESIDGSVCCVPCCDLEVWFSLFCDAVFARPALANSGSNSVATHRSRLLPVEPETPLLIQGFINGFRGIYVRGQSEWQGISLIKALVRTHVRRLTWYARASPIPAGPVVAFQLT